MRLAKMKATYLICLLVLAVSGCAPASFDPTKLIAFTTQLRLQYGFTSEELKLLQYYISDKITLNREVTSAEREIVKGKIVSRFGKIIDEVIVDKLTPGIAVNSSDNTINLSFEEGNFLTFGEESPSLAIKYRLYAKSWSGNIGILNFAGLEYQAINESSKAYVLVSLESIENVVKNLRKLPGRILPP